MTGSFPGANVQQLSRHTEKVRVTVPLQARSSNILHSPCLLDSLTQSSSTEPLLIYTSAKKGRGREPSDIVNLFTEWHFEGLIHHVETKV